MQTVRIKGYSFELSTPFQAGSVITKAEAQALNDLRIENITNNLRDEVSKAQGLLAEGQLLSNETLAELQDRITQYDRGYQFKERHVPKPRRGLIEAEARAIAQAKLEASGQQFSEADFEAKLEELVNLPAIREEARARAQARASVAKESLEDLLG